MPTVCLDCRDSIWLRDAASTPSWQSQNHQPLTGHRISPMSFFSFRRDRTSGIKPEGDGLASESVEAVRRRARHRLIGAAVLVLLGVIGFPLLFDSQPRPVPVNIAIEIPSRAAVKPGAPIASPTATAPATAPVAAPVAPIASAPITVPPQASLQGKEEIVLDKPPGQRAAVASPESAAAKPPAPAKTDAAPTNGRIVVQVGAFADAAKAREARLKLEKAGLKTYTQVIETKDGKRTRVRVGPFASRAEADKAAAKIKALDLPATVLAI